MPIGKIKVTNKQYAIEIDVEDMLHLLRTEVDMFNEDMLGEKLFELSGVENIEYNGHFGAYIYLTISTECDNEATWNQIKEIINKAIDRS